MNKTYDYIIVGAGSAGCVLANRLSADPNLRILVLEAGGKDDHQNIKIPAAFPKIFKSRIDYAYHTVPQSMMSARKMFLPRGKVLGGSSSINAMIYIRGSRQDYQEWSEMGNAGWSYEEVLPYFKKSENQEIIKDDFHGIAGPLNVTHRSYTNRLSEVFVKAGQELGYPINHDFNGDQQEGFGPYQVTYIHGSRCSAASAYLHPISSRKNLAVEVNATVERIVLENGIATGLVYHQNGQLCRAEANKEILLCAGAYNSPQILLLSGIGDGEELRKVDIPISHHLPGVGKNLQDHLVYFTMFHCNYKKTLDSAENFPIVFKHLLNYIIFKKGPFNSNVGEAGGFVKSGLDQPTVDTQFHFGPSYFANHGFDNPTRGNGYSIGGKVLNPGSKGTVKLISSDFRVAPAIDHNYLSVDDDVRRSVWGYKLTEKLGMTKAFESYRTGWFIPSGPITDDLAIEDHIRTTGESLYHPAGTCKMGLDEMSVVNNELKVHGINDLRVVDASIMPNVTRGNTNAPTIMIAEKAADMILGGQ